MKIIYLIAALIITSQGLFCQTMSIYKTDQSTLSFQLADIDSISISVTSATMPAENSSSQVLPDVSGNQTDYQAQEGSTNINITEPVCISTVKSVSLYSSTPASSGFGKVQVKDVGLSGGI